MGILGAALGLGNLDDDVLAPVGTSTASAATKKALIVID